MSDKDVDICRKHVLQELRNSFKQIKNNYKYIKKLDSIGEEVINSGEWLLDNIYLIEKEYKSIKDNMPKTYFDNLPPKYNDDKGEARILACVREYTKSAGLHINEKELIKFIKDKEYELTMGEIWAIPLMLRISLITSISDISDSIVSIEQEKLKGKYAAYKVIDENKDERIKSVLNKLEKQEINELFLESMKKTLKDNSIEKNMVWNFIDKLKVNKSIFNEGDTEELISKCISSLRSIESTDWKKFFNQISKVEEILNRDPSNIYSEMEFKSKDYYRHEIERLSRKFNVDEVTLTKIAYELALEKDEKELYKRHIGYYIIDDGVKELRNKLGTSGKDKERISAGSFIAINILGTIVIIAAAILGIKFVGVNVTTRKMIIWALLIMIPASEIVVSVINIFVSKRMPVSFLPKLNYLNTVPDESKTIVVIPAILSSVKRTKELLGQLEVAYHANKSANIYFALLGDFKDSIYEKLKEDDEIISEALKETLRLNFKYFGGEKHFFFLNRKRIFNPKEKVFMGYERKRGKLIEFMELIRGSYNHTFNVISSDTDVLRDVKYLITLDADTFMPKDSAFHLIGTISHVLNRAKIKDKKVVRGYGIMQPKVSISIESKNYTPFAKIFAGDGGIDGYSIAYSDTYQDLFGEGSFVGKGIIDIDVFREVIDGLIKENTILSHDLLEGALVRSALVTDVEFIDNYPSTYESSSIRLHRWVRGDWQLLKWLFSSRLSLLSRWKIFDNLRRSLLAPSLMLILLLNITTLNGEKQIAVMCFLAAVIPLLFNITDFVVTPKNKIIGTFKSLKQTMIILSFIPYQSYMMIDAIIRTLFRMFISKKHLLQWKTAEEAEKETNNSSFAYVKRMWFSIAVGIGIIFISILNASMLVTIINAFIGALWIVSPYIAYSLSIPYEEDKFELSHGEKTFLRDNTRRIWAYYEDFVNDENNYLAPDNYQEKPYKGIANRTSPTNIGMGLMSNIAAYDLGYLSLGGVIDRIELILEGMRKLDKFKGHYLNWYDTRKCEPLWPKYISTVDSGNLLGYLWIISNTLVEYKSNPLIRDEEIKSLHDTLEIVGLNLKLTEKVTLKNYDTILEEILLKIEESDISRIKDKEKIYWVNKLKYEIKTKMSYYEYLFDGMQKFIGDKFENNAPNIYEYIDYIEELIKVSGQDLKELLEEKLTSIKTLLNRIDSSILEINSIIKDMDFRFLYNENKGLFTIGYNLEEKSMGESFYDLLASESRATSFIAIALNQVPKEHWFKLGRAMTNAFKEKSLVSWSGTMFEYFMPSLIMKSYDETLLGMTYSSVIAAQQKYAESKGVPWGISESAYYYFDSGNNYQYKAFGVEGIGLKRGLEDELVISPYSTLITLPFSRKEGIRNLKRLKKKGAYGRYGFIESIDYTANRLNRMDTDENEKKYKHVRCYMVHHLGMSFLALDNTLKDNILQRRFHSIPEVKANELLLKEKIPENITFEREEELVETKKIINKEEFVPRIYEGVKRNNQEVLLLSNGSYSLMTTLSGSGYAKKGDMTVYRWKGDNTSDSSGSFIYIKNLNSNDYWSATYEPCKNAGDDSAIEFKCDVGIFRRKDGSIESELDVVVSPEDDVEIRKVVLRNTGEKARSIEVTSYMEVTLQSFEGDAVHPSFSNLFISTEYIEDRKCLLGSRRPRAKNAVTPFIFHNLVTEEELEGSITYETSRINFIGRNRELEQPKAMDNDVALGNTIGTVLDPIMSMRCRLRLEKGEEKTIYYVTGTSDSREDILELIDKYSDVGKLESTFISYSKAVQLELRSLGIKSSQANIYQRLASYILFLHSGRSDREEYIKNIHNSQQDLWAYGISGDLPIAMALVKDSDDMDLVRSMIKMHYYWKSKGLKVDLLIYNNEESTYDQPLQKSILTVLGISKEGDVLNKPGGIFVYNKSTMPENIRDFLIGISSLYVNSAKGSIVTQMRDIDSLENVNLRHKEIESISTDIFLQEERQDKENLLSITKNPIYKDIHETYNIDRLDFWNNYGGFDPKDKSYVIKLDKYNNTPAPWINVISNHDFGFHISETGSSYTWSQNSRENKLTPWSNDWVSDPVSEALYIRDNESGVYFSVTPKPVRDEGEYIIKHSFGYSTFNHTAYGIKGEETVFCPKDEKLKILKVSLENFEEEKRELSIFYYAQLVLGVFNYSSAKYISTFKEDNYIYGQNPYSKYFGKERCYLTILGVDSLSFTGDRKEFLGVEGKVSEPEALKYKNLSNTTGSIYDPCLAAEGKIILEPGEKKEIVVLLGAEENVDLINKNINKYKDIDKCHKALENVKGYWSDFLGNIQVETEDKSMDYLLNGWLLYQTYSCRYLSRTAFYQSGGAYGYRDQLQDSMSLGIVKPDITKAQILRSASKQYIEGDVQHWWHPVINSGIRTRFSDDLLWLPYVTSEYIKKTGDYSILNESAKYLEDEPLKEGEDERYTIVETSNIEGTIYEHCIKAIERSLKFGEHNIPLMGSGDWNDGMSAVGNKGKGESVWLGWFLYSILDNFDDICSHVSDDKRRKFFNERKEFIKENIEKEAWDGGWYRRAYFDDGTPLGSRDNEECQIDSLAQSWALISGASTGKRAEEAMKAVDSNLVKKDKGMILLLAPPFEKSNLEPGYIKGYVAGVRENGGQYTHAAVWVILALTKMGLGDKATKYYNMINPINHTKTELECRNYKTEPYVMSADVYIREPHGGRGGWSWYTGASGWMYKVGIEDILGLKEIKGEYYEISPCIPNRWREYCIKINNETENYTIKIINGNTNKLIINEKIIEGNRIPRNKGKLNVIVERKSNK